MLAVVPEDPIKPPSSWACTVVTVPDGGAGKSPEVRDKEDALSDGVMAASVEDKSAAVRRDDRLGVCEVEPLNGHETRSVIVKLEITTYKGFRTGTMARSLSQPVAEGVPSTTAAASPIVDEESPLSDVDVEE